MQRHLLRNCSSINAALLLSLITAVVMARAGGSAPTVVAPATVGPVVISIPPGFEAAQTQKQHNVLVTAWTKSVRDGSVKTLLQINIVDFGSHAGKPPSLQELAAGAEQYLRQFLGDIERRRTGYRSSAIAHIELAGLPATRATWNGAVGTRDTVGVMYCVIVRGRFAVVFHTQDLGNTPSPGMLEAMKAIETVTLAGRS